ncbi:MAG: DNA cytosine methyltransferase [Proteobacteria bacterium]|nr:DNA cytosine methyltransferase [Pseudomonadota bacterium]
MFFAQFFSKRFLRVDLHPFRILSLCSGVGGIELGFKLAEPTARTVCYVEIEAFTCEILARRMEEKRLDQAPIWTNLKTFDGKPWRGKVDCITGGYPCQPFSVAGKKLGDKDSRHLWPEIKRLITEIEPPICFFENVGGHLRLGFEEVANDLQQLGYQVKAGLFTAAEVGAPHKRERLFILAYRGFIGCDSGRNNIAKRHLQTNLDGQPKKNQQKWKRWISWLGPISKDLADCQNIVSQWCKQQRSGSRKSEAEIGSNDSELGNTDCTGLEGQCEYRCSDQFSAWPPSPSDYEGWDQISDDLKPAIHRMADGMADRVDRIRACGNGVVPLVAAYAWRTLTNGMRLTKNKLENHG